MKQHPPSNFFAAKDKDMFFSNTLASPGQKASIWGNSLISSHSHHVEHKGPPTKWPRNQWEKTFPTKSFHGRVWFVHKRNQILRNCFLDNPTAQITPVIPTNFMDLMVVALYYNGPRAVSTEVVESFIKAYAGELPTPAEVAQFFDPVMETVPSQQRMDLRSLPQKGGQHRHWQVWAEQACSTKTSMKTVNKRRQDKR
jgi:hypothetical protein